MKFLPLILSGLLRNRLRTAFTLMSITVAFLLFGLLQAVDSAFKQAARDANVNRLYVNSRISLVEPLPLSYLSRLERVAGVDLVVYASYVQAYYQDPKNSILLRAVEPVHYFKMYPEIILSSESLQAMQQRRTGAVIGVELAKAFNLKVGDRAPFRGATPVVETGPAEVILDIVGIFDNPGNRSDTYAIFFNHTYLEEIRNIAKGTAGGFMVRLQDAQQAAIVAATIDKMFSNSDGETRTQSEKELAQFLLRQIGDINVMVLGVTYAVFFILLFLTGNAMMQSFRERIPEMAVLKTLGYSDMAVAGLVLAEALLLCLAAALLGLGMAMTLGFTSAVLLPEITVMVGDIKLSATGVIVSLSAAVLLAVVSGAPPAWRSTRIDIARALAGR